MRRLFAFFTGLAMLAGPGAAAERRIGLAEYRDKVHAAWIGQIIGASYGFNFEGKARNAITLDRYLNHYEYALVDDDYFYEMVALYGFERYGIAMPVEQLGEMWKEYRAGTWGSSEQARYALERGIRAPETGSPRYNRWFHTIGPQFSADIYGMIAPGMVNLAGEVARRYSHVNGYAEGSDGAVFVAACISEAFFETDREKIVRQAAGLIHPGSNYRKAIDMVLAGYSQHKTSREIAAESESRWRPDYPQLNNSVANGALVAIGILFGEGDYLKSLNVTTQTGDFNDADCNAANVSAVVGAMRGWKAIPDQFIEPLHNRIYGDHMGPLKFGRVIDERIDDLARRIADVGVKNLLAHGGRLDGDTLVIPQEQVRTQPLEFFDINDYGELWNAAWRLEGAGRGGAGATYLDGDVLVTFPRDTRPCMLIRVVKVPDKDPSLLLEVGHLAKRPWRLQVFVEDEPVRTEIVGGGRGAPAGEVPSNAGNTTAIFTKLSIDLAPYAGRTVTLRLYHWLAEDSVPGAAYWRVAKVQ